MFCTAAVGAAVLCSERGAWLLTEKHVVRDISLAQTNAGRSTACDVISEIRKSEMFQSHGPDPLP